MKKKLLKTFNYYNKKYKLNAILVLGKCRWVGGACSIIPEIEMKIKTIINTYKKNSSLRARIGKITLKEVPIWILLHEIKHHIDEKKHPKTHNIDYLRAYLNNTEYHKNPFEVNADKFARKELKKWT